MSLKKTWLALLICGGAPLSAFAGEWSSKCEQAGKKAQSACQGASNAAKAADNAQAAGNISGVGSHSTVNPGAGALQQQAKDQAGRLTNAKSQCEQEKNKCESECQQEESKRAQAAAGPPQNPRTQQAQADKGPLEEKKQSACIAPLMAMIGDLGSGASQAAQAASDSGKTGSSSGAGMPMPMPMPSDKKGDESGTSGQTQNPTATALNCETEGYSRYSDCNNHYIEKCQNAMTATGCDGFINRYCGNYTPSPTPTQNTSTGNDSISLSAQSTAATANLVADKQGEGLGSAFCKKATAYKFCQMAGRSECPSCKNLNNPWPMEANLGQLADAQRSCPTDPLFLDATVQQKLNSSNTAASSTTSSTTPTVSTQSTRDRMSSGAGPGMAGSGGGGLSTHGGAGGAGAAGGGPNGAVAESYNGPSLAMGSGYGGGAGGSYEGSSNGPGYEPHSVNGDNSRSPASVASTVQGGPRDVAVQYGPSIFSIQSTTYRDLCDRGRFLHCRR